MPSTTPKAMTIFLICSPAECKTLRQATNFRPALDLDQAEIDEAYELQGGHCFSCGAFRGKMRPVTVTYGGKK